MAATVSASVSQVSARYTSPSRRPVCATEAIFFLDIPTRRGGASDFNDLEAECVDFDGLEAADVTLWKAAFPEDSQLAPLRSSWAVQRLSPQRSLAIKPVWIRISFI
jgi:hypothetical protein